MRLRSEYNGTMNCTVDYYNKTHDQNQQYLLNTIDTIMRQMVLRYTTHVTNRDHNKTDGQHKMMQKTSNIIIACILATWSDAVSLSMITR